MKVGITDAAWDRVKRSVHFTERQTGAGGRLPPGRNSGSPVFVRAGTLAPTPVTDCDNCPDGAPREWRVVLAGFEDCAGAVDPNGTLTLTFTSACTWVGTLNDIEWTLTYSAGLWTLTDDGAIGATYQLAGSSWACSRPNELARVAVDDCVGSPTTLTLTAASGVTTHAGVYDAVFQLWNNTTAAFEDADSPNECYAVAIDGSALEDGAVYRGAVVWQYAESGKVLVVVGAVDVGDAGSDITTSTPIHCPVSPETDCCILYAECEEVYDCNGEPIDRSDVDFDAVCEDGPEGVSATIPTNCGDRESHCGNTVGACGPRCDYPESEDVLEDADAPGDCCEPTEGSVMSLSPHAGECGFFPPCLTVTGGSGTGALAGVTFDATALLNFDAEWTLSFSAPGGNFYIRGVLTLCLNSPFPGWYFYGRLYVFNPAGVGSGGSGGDPQSCGCDTGFGVCPTAADDADQEIVAFHLGDKTETLRLTTVCGTLDLGIEPCAAPVEPVRYGCEASSRGTFCVEMVDGPYTNDPTCGGNCTEDPPDPPVEENDCCDSEGQALETHPDLEAYINLTIGTTPEDYFTFTWGGSEYTATVGVYTWTLSCTAGTWTMSGGGISLPVEPTVVSCSPFGLVFPRLPLNAHNDVVVYLA